PVRAGQRYDAALVTDIGKIGDDVSLGIGNVCQVAAGAGKDQAARRKQLAILEHFQTGPGSTGCGLPPDYPARPPLVLEEKCEHCLTSMHRSSPLTQGKEQAGPLPRFSRLATLFRPAPGQGPRRSAAALSRRLPTTPAPVVVRFVESPAGMS